MEKVWTTVCLPPSADHISELSCSALKIIFYLKTPEKFLFSPGLFEENSEEHFDVFKLSDTNNNTNNKDKVLANDENDSQDQFYESLTNTSRLINLNESVDMFNDSLTCNTSFHVKANSKPISCNITLDRNINILTNLSNEKITHYFPVRKKIISEGKDANQQFSENFNLNSNKRPKSITEYYSPMKKNLKRMVEVISDNNSFKKQLPQKYNSISVMNHFKSLTELKNKSDHVSSVMDFCHLPKGKFKTTKNLSSPLPLISFNTSSSNAFSYREEQNIVKYKSGYKLECPNISKLRESSEHMMDDKGNEGNVILPVLTNIVYLNQDNIETANKALFDKELTEIGFTICYSGRFCLLNKPPTKDKCCPNGLLLCAKYLDNHSDFFFFSSEGFRNEKLKKLLANVLGSLTRKVCYEAQAFMLFMLDNIASGDKRVCYDWCILDPLVAAWLLDPDSPPCSFDGLLKCIVFSKLQKEENWLSECCTYLQYQSQTMEYLYSQLIKYNLWEVFLHLETKIIPILAVLETSNIMINVNILKKMKTILQEKLNSLESEAETIAGHRFSLKSPLQISKVLYEELKLDEANKISDKNTTRKGKKSTSESILKLLGNIHPLPRLILEYRRLWKLKSSYVDIILQHASKKQSITAIWELCAATTGRITSRNPNLQAIPKRPITIEIVGKKLEFNLRSCFTARKGYIFVAADFQHIELRLFAHLAKDKILMDLLNKEGDIFMMMSDIRLKKKELTKEERDQTKTLVYALMYGAGAKKLASILSLEESQVEEIKNSLYEIFPRLCNFRKQILNEVRKSKVLKTLSGRRRMFHSIVSKNSALRNSTERKAINFIIQGSAADICKFTMLRIERKLKDTKFNGRLVLQIHDELLWEVENTSYKNMISLLEEVMESNKHSWRKEFNIQIPLPVVITSGNNWGHMI